MSEYRELFRHTLFIIEAVSFGSTDLCWAKAMFGKERDILIKVTGDETVVVCFFNQREKGKKALGKIFDKHCDNVLVGEWIDDNEKLSISFKADNMEVSYKIMHDLAVELLLPNNHH